MFNFITGNPAVMLVALIGGLNSITTVNEGYTGVVVRGDRIVRQLPPGAHYRFPIVEEVIHVNTSTSHQEMLTHETALASHEICDFRVQYGYLFDDPEQAVRTAHDLRSGRIKSIAMEERVRDQIDQFAGQTMIADLDRNFSRRFDTHIGALNEHTFDDGARIVNISLSKMECEDPVAAAGLEKSQRPLFRPGGSARFEAVRACGSVDPDSTELELPTMKVISRSGIPVDLNGFTIAYKLLDRSNEHPHPRLIHSYTSTALSSLFGMIDAESLGALNVCSLLLENADLAYALERSGIELVALDPNTPQYAIYEYIEYADDPAD